jgi:hypothetical protein
MAMTSMDRPDPDILWPPAFYMNVSQIACDVPRIPSAMELKLEKGRIAPGREHAAYSTINARARGDA